MMIIETSNFDHDNFIERIIAAKIPDREFAELLQDCLNTVHSGQYAPLYYKIVEDDYILPVVVA